MAQQSRPRKPALHSLTAALALCAALALGVAPCASLKCSAWSWKTCIDLGDGTKVLTCNKEMGSGMEVPQHYTSGMFSVDMKLPKGDSGGHIVSFYLMDSVTRSNREFDHAEIDFEFYGNKTGKDIIMALNVFADSHQNLAQFKLPFDPSAAYHNYGLLYNTKQIIWFVDGRPIRILNREKGKPWPRYSVQPQATIWEVDWLGLKVNYSNGPVSALYSTYKGAGCEADNHEVHLTYDDMDKGYACEGPWNKPLSPLHREAYRKLHDEHLVAHYGWDKIWNAIPDPRDYEIPKNQRMSLEGPYDG